jgi:two-component system sensor histidine kinase AtoS
MPLSDLQNMVNIVYRSLLIAFIISLVFPVLKGPVEEFVNKYIFPGQSHYQRELKNISRDLGKLYDLPELKNFVIKQLINTMKIKVADLVIFNLNSLGSPSFREMLDNPLIYLMKDKKDILVSYELKRSLSFEEYEKIKRGFDILNAVVIIPLMIKEDMIGFISLGEKLSGDIYSIEDINFLSTIGNQVAVAIQNAKLYNQILQIKEYNENILEQMANGVITVDKEMNITTFNKKARELINIHSWTVIGKKIDMIQNEIAGLIHETLKSEKGFSNIETYLFTNKGLRIPINCSTSLLKDHQGKIIGALAVFTDLTEIKQLEAEVRRAERLATIGTLAAGMAHEIKNPLVSLKTFTQLLPSKYDDPEFRNGFAEIAQKEVDRINNIVEQLLRFAAPSKPIFVSHDIHQSIDETLFLLASEISKKGVKIEKNLSKENFTVFADKEQLKQVFINIFMNALDAIAKNKEPIISISTNVMESTNKEIFNLPKLSKRYSLTNREVVVKISDNGVGIPEEIINHIFDPFFTTKEKGHGLGLSIAHRIVREHGGFISVQSKVGEGATFSISLPIIEEIKEDWKEFQDEAFADRLQ